MDQNSKSFIDLPSDILFSIFSECGVLDILSLSSTCKQLQQTTDEYQVWLDQAICLEIPVLPRTPSKTQLKDWVVSRTRAKVCWTKPRPGELSLHLFKTDVKFLDAHLIPGGEFIVILYRNGDIGLNKIKRSAVTGDLKVREVARYKDTTADDYPSCWSRLLTETSYGCPVLIWVGTFHWEDPFVFLIDPVSQVIEKKHHMHCDFDVDGALDLWKILAIKDRMFFILDGVEETFWITVVVEPGPKAVTKHFGLTLPVDDSSYETRAFVVSENGLVVTNHLGIWLYHIPELRTISENTRLVPVWGRSLNASDCRGTLYKTASPYPALWLQGKQATHTLEFDVDELGYPVVMNHHITEGRPAFYVGNDLKLQGRKGMGIEMERRGEIVFHTGILGKPDTRRLRAPIPGLNDSPRFTKDEVKYTDLDEVTGRIMVVVGPVSGRRRDIPYAQKLYIADLPA